MFHVYWSFELQEPFSPHQNMSADQRNLYWFLRPGQNPVELLRTTPPLEDALEEGSQEDARTAQDSAVDTVSIAIA